MDLVPGKLRYLCIYNPTLGTTQKELHKQILYYHSEDGPVSVNEQLREIGLAQGMVEFSKELSGGERLTHVTSKKTRTLVVNLEGDIWAALCVHLPVEVRNGVVGEYTMKGLSGVDVMIGELRQCWGRWRLFNEHDERDVSYTSHVSGLKIDLNTDQRASNSTGSLVATKPKSSLCNEVVPDESRDGEETSDNVNSQSHDHSDADQEGTTDHDKPEPGDTSTVVQTNGSREQSRYVPEGATNVGVGASETIEPESSRSDGKAHDSSRDEENGKSDTVVDNGKKSHDLSASQITQGSTTSDSLRSSDALSSFFNAFSSCWNPNLHSRGILDSIPYTEIDRIKLSEDTTQVIEAVLSKDPNLVHCSIARSESRDLGNRTQGHSKIVYSSSPCFPLSFWLLECCDIGDEMAFAEESGFVSHVSIRKSRAQLADYASENPSPSPTYISKLGTLTQSTVSTLTSWNPWKQHYPNSEEAIAPEDDVEDGKFVVKGRVACTKEYGVSYLVVYQRAPLTFALLYKDTTDIVYPNLNLKLASLVEPVVRDIERGSGNPHYPKLLASPDPFYYIVVDSKQKTLTTNLRHVPFDTEVVNFVNPNPDPHNSEVAHVHAQFGRLMSQQEAFLGHEKLARSNQNWWFYWTRLPDQRQIYMARKWLKSKPSADGHSVTYPNVLIPVNPTWKSDFECLYHLSQQCPCLQFIGVTTSYNVAPLFALEGSIYPEIEPPFRNCVGWVLKPTQKWVGISSNRRLSEVNKTLDSQTQQLNEMKDQTRGLGWTKELRSKALSGENEYQDNLSIEKDSHSDIADNHGLFKGKSANKNNFVRSDGASHDISAGHSEIDTDRNHSSYHPTNMHHWDVFSKYIHKNDLKLSDRYDSRDRRQLDSEIFNSNSRHQSRPRDSLQHDSRRSNNL
ncbi:hypothetical protein B0I72DRAFT_174159 [Yarrowia lipolytica]|nr:hypothetical protein BKA91DRAFT_166275 [Yarrowia lipolytica]KAE8174843.1 hypothetical protein BKA90DRAFT_166311 [Yarrowia lipolytica]RDW32905.1 hypothetical protein B0I72DRAFT_174159 [Yarrowia lipolytica]RMI97559.1 hypothetical protein BD777DRAFT_152811 [Yarrowia lipolytica]